MTNIPTKPRIFPAAASHVEFLLSSIIWMTFCIKMEGMLLTTELKIIRISITGIRTG